MSPIDSLRALEECWDGTAGRRGFVRRLPSASDGELSMLLASAGSIRPSSSTPQPNIAQRVWQRGAGVQISKDDVDRDERSRRIHMKSNPKFPVSPSPHAHGPCITLLP